ncbi:MAG: 2-C-methyl-D-erythritol 4-phosphate cytidylyltransferase [Lachnoclostridium edouardi]|uniref:2-C-methyl-D-erythritol 4-phosphate cytidylyltransferase n=1 Tax=Lachnoclostridium edouardi TaxID=1926283 RepID=UPI0026DAD106|nr:2-C-methyl-D-erythritol 4-phosphate cytidylyltransferase [Lachnoclostridium edouardi]MDO4278993.1 2-C-methyl-D-erythritol 4-phosphate cytidylyltransferase [Lachnoclostridium edouardi]
MDEVKKNDHNKAIKTAAVVLAAGQGRRMNSAIQKQFMLLGGKPLIYYSLKALENSAIDQVILVTGKDEIQYCQDEIVKKYNLKKVKAVVAGGEERYHSVYQGLKALDEKEIGWVLIHDGARPLVTEKILQAAADGARKYNACVIGMPVKDTVKIADANGNAEITPDRAFVWQIQTPQAFQYTLIRSAYDKLFTKKEYQQGITDDAMVVEHMTDRKVKLIQGDYKNLKVTTPEDLKIAEVFLNENKGEEQKNQ